MFKKLTDDARLPERATRYSAGFDVFANEDVVIGAGETKLIGLGIALDKNAIRLMVMRKSCVFKTNDEHDWTFFGSVKEMKQKYTEFKSSHYFALHIRSSLRSKGLTSLGTGIIDMDYRDEIKMVIHYPIDHFSFVNDIPHEYEIKRGDKIGQLILCRHEGWLLPEEYTKDEERTGGFGSTDQ